MSEPDPLLPSRADLSARLGRHAEQLRDALQLREYDGTGVDLSHDEELHAVAYRLLTTIDLISAREEHDKES